ncbi:DUF6519 domain-containing protein [Micromonospora humida]|uniref:DUF6519 domain-containing protein n=1 Tax=Micromonospora humida TaxID=2809018 RepID=UPI003448F130
MVAPLAGVDAGTIRPDAPGHDERLGFGKGDWLEVNDPARVRRGLPGFLAQLREDGVQVQFDTAGSYRTGYYWLIPARTANLSAGTRRARPATSNGRVTTPARGAGPAGGVAHSFAPVALLDLAAAGTWTQVADLRRLFRPLTASAGATVAIPARGRRAEGVERGGGVRVPADRAGRHGVTGRRRGGGALAADRRHPRRRRSAVVRGAG